MDDTTKVYIYASTVGFIAGMWVCIMFFIPGWEAIESYRKCVKKGIPISATMAGNYYVWDEKNQVSYKISETDMKRLANSK